MPKQNFIGTIKEVDNYKQAHISLVNMKNVSVKVTRDVVWKKWNGRMFKTNWDASNCAASKKMGMRIVMRDVAVELVATLSKAVNHVASPK